MFNEISKQEVIAIQTELAYISRLADEIGIPLVIQAEDKENLSLDQIRKLKAKYYQEHKAIARLEKLLSQIDGWNDVSYIDRIDYVRDNNLD